jgi:hypothetical protein
MSQKLHQSGSQRIPRLSDVHHCGRLATDMLQGALDSLARMDVDAARQVIGADKAIDAAFNAILRQLITYMMEDPRTISEALDIIWIAKAIERVGDHATNIAENVIYIVSGIDIRHSAVAAQQDGRRMIAHAHPVWRWFSSSRTTRESRSCCAFTLVCGGYQALCVDTAEAGRDACLRETLAGSWR